MKIENTEDLVKYLSKISESQIPKDLYTTVAEALIANYEFYKGYTNNIDPEVEDLFRNVAYPLEELIIRSELSIPFLIKEIEKMVVNKKAKEIIDDFYLYVSRRHEIIQ